MIPAVCCLLVCGEGNAYRVRSKVSSPAAQLQIRPCVLFVGRGATARVSAVCGLCLRVRLACLAIAQMGSVSEAAGGGEVCEIVDCGGPTRVIEAGAHGSGCAHDNCRGAALLSMERP